jgi:hypothetical protein
MNVVHSCRVCEEALDANEQVIGVRRPVEVPNTGTLEVQTRADDGYVHPEHEQDAAAEGYRRIGTGTLLEQETRRNPALFRQ